MVFSCSMTTLPSSPGHPGLRVLRDLGAGLCILAALAAALWGSAGLSAAYPLKVLAVYAATATVILAAGPRAFPGPGLGAANRVTLLRAVLAALLAGLVLEPAGVRAGLAPWVLGLGTVGLVLDGVDGWIARRTRTETAFGARFDMETDAALILVLSLLVWRTGQAPAWVLVVGGMRYAFVAAGWAVPALRAELPASFRRKLICVVQGISLLVAVAPVTPVPLATAVAGVAALLLSGSFATDTAWLLRNAGRAADRRSGATPRRDGVSPPGGVVEARP